MGMMNAIDHHHHHNHQIQQALHSWRSPAPFLSL
jgi:hypothetical protein